MYGWDKLKRRSDGKVFEITLHSHWSNIRAEDGEVDRVKWCWGDGETATYVSFDQGHGYTIDMSGRTAERESAYYAKLRAARGS